MVGTQLQIEEHQIRPVGVNGLHGPVQRTRSGLHHHLHRLRRHSAKHRLKMLQSTGFIINQKSVEWLHRLEWEVKALP